MDRLRRALTALALLAWAGCAAAQAVPLGELRAQLELRADPAAVSVSGISSGGYMAHQFHLAHSDRTIGAGIVAGGPYACPAIDNFWCDWTWYGWGLEGDVCQAVYVCTAFVRSESLNPFMDRWLYFGPPGHEFSLEQARQAAAAGRIAPLAGLAGDRVWLLAGEADEVVPQAVMEDLAALYRALMPGAAAGDLARIAPRNLPHAMPVDLPGQPDDCSRDGPPFINDCSLDAAGRLLAHIHRLPDGPDQDPPPDAWSADSLFSFDQTAFFDDSDPSASLGATGHVYVPERCRAGEPCPVHVAFHGCRQTEALTRAACEGGDCPLRLFFEDAGYNPWAERHGLVILYPQATAWGGATEADKNPRACWDWWGYSGEAYATRDGKQVRAVKAMVDCLTGAGPCSGGVARED